MFGYIFYISESMKARIYKPTKNAMQSGIRNSKLWVLEFFSSDPKFIEPIMGWIGSSDTMQQVKLKFHSKEDAAAFAKHHQIECEVEEPNKSSIKPKSYAANFQ